MITRLTVRKPLIFSDGRLYSMNSDRIRNQVAYNLNIRGFPFISLNSQSHIQSCRFILSQFHERRMMAPTLLNSLEPRSVTGLCRGSLGDLCTNRTCSGGIYDVSGWVSSRRFKYYTTVIIHISDIGCRSTSPAQRINGEGVICGCEGKKPFNAQDYGSASCLRCWNITTIQIQGCIIRRYTLLLYM